MFFLYNIFFSIIGVIIGTILVYTRAYLRYENKEKIDKCYKERKELKIENEKQKNEIEQLNKKIEKLEKELEKAKKEIMEKNKLLAEDTVIIENLYKTKKLADQISDILLDYDKEIIKHLLTEYKKGYNEDEETENEEQTENENELEEKRW